MTLDFHSHACLFAGKQALSYFGDMVQLHVKRGEESQFLYNTTVDVPLETVITQVTAIYNGRLKVDRVCSGERVFIQEEVLVTFSVQQDTLT